MLAADLSWDRTAKSVVVAEGLTPYLPAAAVRSMFDQCREVVGTDSRIAFTHIAAGDDRGPDIGRWTGLVMWLLKMSGEPWLWSIRPEGLATFLDATGWRLQPELKGGPCRHGVEYFAVASK